MSDQYLEAAAKEVELLFEMNVMTEIPFEIEDLVSRAIEAWVGDREPYTIDLPRQGGEADWLNWPPMIERAINEGVLVRVSVEGNQHESE